jgi:hypothetical protein
MGTLGQERLNTLAALSVRKDAIAGSSRFGQQVIELFESEKNRRGQFLHK